jgi:hypothetical protein
MASGDASRLSQEALAGAIVVARDSMGGQWRARSTGAGSFVVDALPVGSYTIAVDGSDLAEPVVPVGSPPRVDVGGDVITPAVDVVLRARPLRMRTFDGTAPLPTAPNAEPATERAPERVLESSADATSRAGQSAATSAARPSTRQESRRAAPVPQAP